MALPSTKLTWAGCQRLFLCLLAICVVVQGHASGQGHQHDHRHDHHHHWRRDGQPRAPSPSSSAVPSTSTTSMSFVDAQAVVNAALQAVAVMNQGRVDNPQRNKYQFGNASVTENHSPAPPLPYNQTTGEVVRRAGSHNTTTGNANTYAYTIPEQVAEAARLLAEASPQIPAPRNEEKIAQIVREKRKTVNDTNMPKQVLRRSNGFGSYVSRDSNLESHSLPGSSQSELRKRSDEDFWLTTITQTGESPFAPAGYKVWRNVKDYGAKGDGVTDDTAAINSAISDGGRCGPNCGSSTIYPAFVYFPPGTYLISSPIIQYYNTELYGNPLDYPTILAASSFVGLGVITSDVYTSLTGEWYLNTNNFLRSIRNFKMDITLTDPTAYVCAIHWQVAQATSLENIIFYMMEDDTTTQQGIYMENGSGGFLTNLTFIGGNFGAYFGSQQFTVTQFTFLNCNTAMQIDWDWAWTMEDIIIDSCNQGVVIVGGAGGPMSTGQSVGSLVLLDALISNTPTGIVTSLFADNSTSFLLQNAAFVNVSTAVIDNVRGQTLLAGGPNVAVDSWGFGMLAISSSNSTFVNGQDIPAMNRSTSLTASYGYHNPNFFKRARPTYLDIGMSQIIDVKSWGAAGDGKTDDTAVLNSILDRAANMSSIVFFPFGVYLITDTLNVPVGSRIIGQAWSQIMATGPKFQDQSNPKVAVKVGQAGDIGIIEIQSMMFTVSGPTAGAVLMEWNVHESVQGSVGMWDSHFRVGGAIGSNLQASNCPIQAEVNEDCIAASLLLHITPHASAYLQNVWAWTADHDMDDLAQTQINVYAGRGILIESQGPTWLYGTASEHQVLYQYQISQARDVYMGMIQTESPYYQPSPKAPLPFNSGLFPNDPTFADCDTSSTECAVSWAMRVIDSSTVYSMGSGFYSWFSNYSQTCLNTGNCQLAGLEIAQSTDTWLYNIVTKGMVEMVSPVNENATLAANNVNGFMSSILAWVREDNTTIGAYTFPGFQIYDADDLDGLVTTTCQTALAQTIRCPNYLTMYMSPRVGQSTGNSTFTDLMCSSTCGSSLQSWYDDVSSSCANQTLDYADPTLLGGYIWQGYNETCLKDPSSGEYCTDVVISFSDADSMESMPTDELCSWCWTQMVIMMQNSSYSAFNDYYQSGMQYMVSECSLNASITMPESLIYPRPTVTPMCLSDVNYTIQAGDTCDSIAIAYNVTSASILTNNPMVVNNCSSLIPGNTICMPLPCTPLYTLQPDDDCMTIEWNNGLRDGTLRQYNPWINYFCNNLQESTEILGSVLCLGPQAGKFVSNSSFLPNPPATSNPSTGYSMYVIDPPINATLANGTTTLCGSWYTVNEGDTCAQICSMESIPSSLFLACNPTLNGTNCDANLVVNTTYCVAPMINWDDPSFWVDYDTAPTTSSSTTVPTATQTTIRNGIPTPTPYQPGMVSNCDSFYQVDSVSDNECDIITSNKGISLADFYSWNPAVGTGCDLQLGDYVCVGVTDCTSASVLSAPSQSGLTCGAPGASHDNSGSLLMVSYTTGSPYVESAAACGAQCLATSSCTNFYFIQGSYCNLHEGEYTWALSTNNPYYLWYEAACFSPGSCGALGFSHDNDGSLLIVSYTSGSPYVESAAACGAQCLATSSCTNIYFIEGSYCNLHFGAPTFAPSDASNPYSWYNASCFSSGEACGSYGFSNDSPSTLLVSYTSGSPYVESAAACGAQCLSTSACTNVYFMEGSYCNLHSPSTFRASSASGYYEWYQVGCFACDALG